MSIIFKERLSDSQYIEMITQGHTVSDGSPIRPAETNWHLVFVKQNGNARTLIVGPLMTSGIVTYTEGAELLWVRFKLGTFMPHLPAKHYLNKEMTLPEATSHSFWLKGSAWQLPDFENVETFVNRLVRDEMLVRDSIVNVASHNQPLKIAPRTMRHRFLQATGLTQKHIQQVERAKRAATLLKQGYSILDTVYELGYFDQPHLTRSLKQFIGYTPAQIAQQLKSNHAAKV